MGKDLRGKELGTGIIQEKSGKYVGRVTDNSGKRLSKRFDKLRECRQWVATTMIQKQHGSLLYPMDIFVDAWYAVWFEVKKQTTRTNTINNYETRYNKNIKQYIGSMRVVDVKPMHCQDILIRMGNEGYGNASIQLAKTVLKNMFEYAVDNDIISSNPCKKSIKSNIGKKSSPKKAMTIDEHRKFLQCIKDFKYERQYCFILQTGIRIGELIGLKWSDIDFDQRIITIQRTVEWDSKNKEWVINEPKTEAGIRTIPLTDEGMNILKKQKEYYRTIKIIPIEWSGFVFLTKKGFPVRSSDYNTQLYNICNKNNIRRISAHILRHTFATRCIESNMKPKTLQKILGHSNIGITMNLYVHITDDEKRKEMDLVSKSLLVI